MLILVRWMLIIGIVALTLIDAAQAQFVLYDDFSGSRIDPGRWNGFSIEGTANQPTGEFVRITDASRLHLGLTSYGNTASNVGTVTARQGLSVQQLGTSGGSGFIRGLKAKVTILQASVEDCPLNPEVATPARARAMFTGTHFNDGTNGPMSTGDIVAFMHMYKQGNSGEQGITAGVQRCSNETCTAPIGIAPQPVFAMTWMPGTLLVLKVVWDELNERFTFTVRNPATGISETRHIVYAGIVVAAGPPAGPDRKQIKVENNPENCAAGRKRATIDAAFDQVMVKRQP